MRTELAFRIHTLPWQEDDGAEEDRELARATESGEQLTEEHADGTACLGVCISHSSANRKNAWPAARCEPRDRARL
jgi:hypothetical protein